MRRALLILVFGFVMSGLSKHVEAEQFFPEIIKYVEDRIAEFDAIAPARKAELEQVSNYIAQTISQSGTAGLTFVCTHNSRRSQLAEVWAAVAASHFGINGIETFSGGTEVTALNERTVEALRRCGLEISADDEAVENPHYRVQFRDGGPTQTCFSKLVDAAPNPSIHFCAVMTCSHADESCPTVKGCDFRVALTYEDPKHADDTPLEQAAYDERSRQIAREMLYMISRVKGS